jgi:hypothetical protein
MDRFDSIGVIRNTAQFDSERLDAFESGINKLRNCGSWSKEDIVGLFFKILPEFAHMETGKYLDQRM